MAQRPQCHPGLRAAAPEAEEPVEEATPDAEHSSGEEHEGAETPETADSED